MHEIIITCGCWQAIGPGFTQYVEPVFLSCINLIHTHQVAKVFRRLLSQP